MTFIAFAEVTFLIIQGSTIYRRKSARDVDLSAFLILLGVNLAWMAYGKFIVHDTPLFLSGISYSIGAIFVIVGIIIYGDGEDAKKVDQNS